MFFNNCEKNRHRYEPRYDETPNKEVGNIKMNRASPELVVRLFILNTYVHDICVICGDVVGRNDDIIQEAPNAKRG